MVTLYSPCTPETKSYPTPTPLLCTISAYAYNSPDHL